MGELNLILSLLLFVLVFLQSMAGVGILVIGTPLLLILNYEIIDIMSILLPISIMTSFLNLIYFKINKKKFKMKIDKKIKYLFFLICLPSIFLGIYLLENFYNYINFKFLVSAVIFISFILSKIKILITKLSDKIRIFILFLIGATHGLTNSGGALLSLFMISFNEKNDSRYGITFFYFFLASFQFIIFNIFFNFNVNLLNYTVPYIYILLPIGIILGNYLIKFVKESGFKNIINILSLITCIFLLTNNL